MNLLLALRNCRRLLVVDLLRRLRLRWWISWVLLLLLFCEILRRNLLLLVLSILLLTTTHRWRVAVVVVVNKVIGAHLDSKKKESTSLLFFYFLLFWFNKDPPCNYSYNSNPIIISDHPFPFDFLWKSFLNNELSHSNIKLKFTFNYLKIKNISFFSP